MIDLVYFPNVQCCYNCIAAVIISKDSEELVVNFTLLWWNYIMYLTLYN